MKINIKPNNFATQKIKLNWINLASSAILTKTKIQIAQHSAHRKIIVGAKGTGKSIIPMIKSLIIFEQDRYFNAFGFRKYKEQATNKMATLFFNAFSILEKSKFQFKWDFELRVQKSAIFRLKDKRNMLVNQSFNFGSLEDASGSTDGMAPSNGGYFGVITIDEPVVEKDANNSLKIPSIEQWKKDETIILDNLSRFNAMFEQLHKVKVKTEIYYTMNNWANHPLIQEVDKKLPLEKFLNFIFKVPLEQLLGDEKLVDECFKDDKFLEQLITHNTLSAYDKSNDTLYTRMTKFANPLNLTPEALPLLTNKIATAIKNKDMSLLSILLGTKSVPIIDPNMLVYDIKNFNNQQTLPEILEKNYAIKKINFAWDIDTSRVLTLTPVCLLFQPVINITSGKIQPGAPIIYIDTQMEIVANGSGNIGELNDVYIKMMIQTMIKYYNNLPKKPVEGAIISVDDKRKWFLHELHKNRTSWMHHFKPFDQHAMFGLSNRQDWTHLGFEKGIIRLSPRNIALIGDLQSCMKRDVQDDRRKTTGTTNYLDRIDSFENGFIPFVNLILKGAYNV